MNVFLFIISILVYASFGFSGFFYILFSILTTYFAALSMKEENKKFLLVLSISVNVVLLLLFKVLGVFEFSFLNGLNIIAPLGISYYTLQVISYVVDVYRGMKPSKNFFHYALYVFYFPCLFLGPINRYEKMKETLFQKRKITLENVTSGILRISFGCFKKFIIAGRASIVIFTITTNSYSGAYAFLAMLLYSILLYSDFSGGIDIVLGFSQMLGISLSENFDCPYFAETIKEFWRRWHISLSSWLRDYIYIPLGGNRTSRIRQKFNILFTFFLSGLWHGFSYWLWGICHGVLVAFSNVLQTKWKWFNHLFSFLVVSILWSFFIWPDTMTALRRIGSIFTTWNYVEFFTNASGLGLSITNWVIFGLSVFLLWIFDCKQDAILRKIRSMKPEWKVVFSCVFFLLVFVLGIYGIGFHVEEFIYSKF